MDFLIEPLPINDGVHTISKISALWAPRIDLVVQRAAMLLVPPATTAETDVSASQKLDLSEVIELLLDSTDNEFDAPVRKLPEKVEPPRKTHHIARSLSITQGRRRR